MKLPTQQFGFSQKLLVVALLAALGPMGAAHAEDDEILDLIKPGSTASLGLGVLSSNSGNRTIFGQYNGWSREGGGLLLDLDIVKRDDATGLWTTIDGRNLGQDNRELSFSQQKQGNWKYAVGYSELVRHDPRTINTGLTGAGTSTPTVTALGAVGTGADLNLDLKRKGFTLSGEKWLGPNLMVEASFKSQDKDGARRSGIGGYCSKAITGPYCLTTAGALLMLPEPINSTTQQFDAKLNYSGDKYLVTAGYYGSFFKNENGSLNPTITGNLWPSALSSNVALPPDNQAHQFYVSGNYAFTPTTRANFNVSQTHATQDQDFAGMGLTAAAGLPSNLGGVVDSTVAYVGLTAKPMAKLSVRANWRYEDIKDKTPLAAYNGANANNALNSSEKVNGKAEATYQLPENFRVTVGGDYAYVERSQPSNLIPYTSMTSVREWAEEAGGRIELRRSMSDTLNAAVSVMHSERNGEHWLNLDPSARYPTLYEKVRWADIYSAEGTFPVTMMDRKRDMVRISADWMPTDKLSLQFTLDDGKDKYDAPTTKGFHDTGMRSFGVDAALMLSDDWKLTGYLNQSEQTLHVDHKSGYIAELEDTSTSAGIGVRGTYKGFELGADLSYLDDSNRYGLASGNAESAGVLPDVTYRVTSLNLFGKYALRKNADLRVDLVHQRVKFDEWTWANFAYSDNTTVSMQPNQNVTFLGLRYVYKFR